MGTDGIIWSYETIYQRTGMLSKPQSEPKSVMSQSHSSSLKASDVQLFVLKVVVLCVLIKKSLEYITLSEPRSELDSLGSIKNRRNLMMI